MRNPWNAIKLDDYENHMSLGTVKQLQTMSEIMCSQFYSYPVKEVMVLGIAGGNGLIHIDPEKIRTVYGVDINALYLKECVRRYPNLNKTFIPIQADLLDSELSLPNSDIIIANLLIEYIGYENFQRAVQKVNPLYVSCALQVNSDSGFVSDSPYVHVFDGLETIHHQVTGCGLTQKMAQIGYSQLLQDEALLPNGKKLVRLDYKKADE